MTKIKTQSIINLVETQLSQNDIIKYGHSFYKKFRIQMYFFNISSITRNDYYQKYKQEFKSQNLDNYINFFTLNELTEKLDHFKDAHIISLIPTKGKIYDKIYEHLNNSKFKYSLVLSGNVPVPTLKMDEILFLSLKYPLHFLKKVKNRFNNLQPAICKPQYIFTSSRTSESQFSVSKIKIPSYDYDELISYERAHKNISYNSKKKYFVYLETPPSHPDGLYAKDRFPPEKPCSEKDWFSGLNYFFKNLVKVSGIQIKVLPHPRTTQKCLDSLKYCEIENRNKKIDLIKNSSGVITQASSAISFAIYYDKPIIFIDQNKLTFHNRRKIKYLSKYFNKVPVDMKKSINKNKIKHLLKVETDRYEKFKLDYLGFPSQKTSHEIIISTLFNKN